MAIPRPPGRIRRVFGNPGTYEFGAFVAPMLSLLPAAARFAAEEKWGWVYFTGGGAVLQALLGGGKALATWKRDQGGNHARDLAGCLHTLHAIMMADWRKTASPGLRLTIHVPIEGERLQQVLDYVGDERVKRTEGRIFSAHSGITGRTLRDKAMFVASRRNAAYEPYIQELVSEWNYSEDAARKLSPATMSWLAIPLTNDKTSKVEGIVYADSTERRFFTQRRITMAALASAGIGVFVSKRYGN